MSFFRQLEEELRGIFLSHIVHLKVSIDCSVPSLFVSFFLFVSSKPCEKEGILL